jgi:hypothetical protein
MLLSFIFPLFIVPYIGSTGRCDNSLNRQRDKNLPRVIDTDYNKYEKLRLKLTICEATFAVRISF